MSEKPDFPEFPDFPDFPDEADLPSDAAAAAPVDFSAPEGFRSGFVSFVGRPNTGKSTLTNALVGEKIAITADQPETTRHPIRGIVHRPDSQIIVVDTPGLHRPRTLLGERLNEVVKETYADVDVIGLCVPADEKIGPGDRWILDAVRSSAPKTPVVGIVTKLDKASKDQVGAQLMALHDLLDGGRGRAGLGHRRGAARRPARRVHPPAARGAEVLPGRPRHRRRPRHPDVGADP
jgi:GTP-binding protein Era